MGKGYNTDSTCPEAVYSVLSADSGPLELREKGSRFISFAIKCCTMEEADKIIAAYRKKYFDATHLCYAFCLRIGQREYKRSSDDGEPSGTAGVPIMQEILGSGLWNLLVMVIRYYGGTKLGTGGLVRAYGGAAQLVLDSAESRQVEITLKGSIVLPFRETGLVMQWLNRHHGLSIEQNYSDRGIVMTVALPINEAATARQSLIDMSSGRLEWIAAQETDDTAGL